MQTEQPQMGRRVLRHHIWGYSVCLCPTKGTPGLNELNLKSQPRHLGEESTGRHHKNVTKPMKRVQACNDQEMAQSERNPHSINRGVGKTRLLFPNKVNLNAYYLVSLLLYLDFKYNRTLAIRNYNLNLKWES